MRDMKVDEPGSTGTSKLAIITGPVGLDVAWADAAALEVGKQPRANNKKNAHTKPKIETRKILPLWFSKLSSNAG